MIFHQSSLKFCYKIVSLIQLLLKLWNFRREPNGASVNHLICPLTIKCFRVAWRDDLENCLHSPITPSVTRNNCSMECSASMSCIEMWCPRNTLWIPYVDHVSSLTYRKEIRRITLAIPDSAIVHDKTFRTRFRTFLKDKITFKTAEKNSSND